MLSSTLEIRNSSKNTYACSIITAYMCVIMRGTLVKRSLESERLLDWIRGMRRMISRRFQPYADYYRGYQLSVQLRHRTTKLCICAIRTRRFSYRSADGYKTLEAQRVGLFTKYFAGARLESIAGVGNHLHATLALPSQSSLAISNHAR
jgi:hypothetical protein